MLNKRYLESGSQPIYSYYNQINSALNIKYPTLHSLKSCQLCRRCTVCVARQGSGRARHQTVGTRQMYWFRSPAPALCRLHLVTTRAGNEPPRSFTNTEKPNFVFKNWEYYMLNWRVHWTYNEHTLTLCALLMLLTLICFMLNYLDILSSYAYTRKFEIWRKNICTSY